MTVMNQFKVAIIAMLFYSFAITSITHSLPDDYVRAHMVNFADLGSDISLDDTAEQIDDSLQQVTNIPVIDIAALVFYSGNILLDLLLNFAFAVPQLFILLIRSISLFFGGLDVTLMLYLQTFASVAVMALYFIGLIQMLAGIRSGRVV